MKKIILLIGYTPQLAAGNQLMGFQGVYPLVRSAGLNTPRKQGSSERKRTLRGVATPLRKERVVTRAILFFIFIFFACSVLNAAAKPVKDPQTASALFYKAVSYMNRLGLRVQGRVQFFAVDDKTLDSLCADSTYKGTELGLYSYKNGVHNIYAMYGIDPDRFMATCAHEYVHAWQAENCPHNQDNVVKEGFARWCEISALTYDGALAEAQRYAMSADPVYGYGFNLLRAYQDKNGVNAMLELVKKIHSSTEIK